MPECSGAPIESRPASAISRLITASCAKVPPAPPYSSGMAAQSRPACPSLSQAARSMMPSSFHFSMCGTNSLGEEAPRLLFEQHEVFGHPGGTRDLQGFHAAFLKLSFL